MATCKGRTVHRGRTQVRVTHWPMIANRRSTCKRARTCCCMSWAGLTRTLFSASYYHTHARWGVGSLPERSWAVYAFLVPARTVASAKFRPHTHTLHQLPQLQRVTPAPVPTQKAEVRALLSRVRPWRRPCRSRSRRGAPARTPGARAPRGRDRDRYRGSAAHATDRYRERCSCRNNLDHEAMAIMHRCHDHDVQAGAGTAHAGHVYVL